MRVIRQVQRSTDDTSRCASRSLIDTTLRIRQPPACPAGNRRALGCGHAIGSVAVAKPIAHFLGVPLDVLVALKVANAARAPCEGGTHFGIIWNSNVLSAIHRCRRMLRRLPPSDRACLHRYSQRQRYWPALGGTMSIDVSLVCASSPATDPRIARRHPLRP